MTEPLRPSGTDLHRDQRAESDDMGSAGLGFTPAQTRGITGGALAGGLVGAVLFLPLGFVDIADMAAGVRFAVAAVIGLLAGAAVGAVFFGGRQPEIEGEAVGTEGIGDTTAADRQRHAS